MTEANRKRLSKHFKKLNVDDPYGKKKEDPKKLDPLPTIPPINPENKGNPNEEEDNA